MTFEDGTREPLHGHNYYVRFKGYGEKLRNDMVEDFLCVKPVIKELCDFLDHKLLIPQNNPHLALEKQGDNWQIVTKQGQFSIPCSDIVMLPIVNTSVELLASFLSEEITKKMWQVNQFRFIRQEVEVEEACGQSAIFVSGESL